MVTNQSGFVEVTGGRIWYCRSGQTDHRPLIVIHGGPAGTHNYLKSLIRLADQREIIFYDQLGCGQSERPNNDALWTVERSVDELDRLITALEIKECYLYGHSWGTIIAAEYLLACQHQVKALILASPCLSISRWHLDAAANISRLPNFWRDVLTSRELDYHSPECQRAVLEYYKRHACRLTPWPNELAEAMKLGNDHIYEYMWGKAEFSVTGTLKEYEFLDQLAAIKMPTLITIGKYDEVSTETAALYQSRLANAELMIFNNSSHLPHIEEKENYLRAVGDYLAKLESN